MRTCNVQMGSEVVTGQLIRRAPNQSRVLFTEPTFNALPEDIRKTARSKDNAVLVKTSEISVNPKEKATA